MILLFQKYCFSNPCILFDGIDNNGCLYFSNLKFTDELMKNKSNSIFLNAVTWDKRPRKIDQLGKKYGMVTWWKPDDKCGVRNKINWNLTNIQNYRFLHVSFQQFLQLQEFLKNGYDVWIPASVMNHHNFFNDDNDFLFSVLYQDMFSNLSDFSKRVIECHQRPHKCTVTSLL